MSEELERNAYELSREEIRLDRKRQEREEEERQREEWENECARRLARYDEALLAKVAELEADASAVAIQEKRMYLSLPETK